MTTLRGSPDDQKNVQNLNLLTNSRAALLVALTQVSDHSILVVRSAVVLTERVEDASCTYQTLGQITKYVHADAVSSLRLESVGAVSPVGLYGEGSFCVRERY